MSRRVMLAGILAVLVAVPGLSLAHTHRYAAELTIGFQTSESDYTGKLTSGDACKGNRLVRVFRTTDGDQLVGSDRTNSRGRWRVHSSEEFDLHGRYEARVRRQVRRPGEHKHVCRGARAAITR